MTKRTNRGRLPNPGHRGCVHPEVGGKRLIVGNTRESSTSKIERRLADLRSPFERQCQYHQVVLQADSVLLHVRKSAAGERLVLRTYDFPVAVEVKPTRKLSIYLLLREFGLDIFGDDLTVISRGECELNHVWVTRRATSAMSTSRSD